jgi:hypothetical protein
LTDHRIQAIDLVGHVNGVFVGRERFDRNARRRALNGVQSDDHDSDDADQAGNNDRR